MLANGPFSSPHSPLSPAPHDPTSPAPLSIAWSHIVSLPGGKLERLQTQLREVKLSRITGHPVSERKVCIRRGLGSGLQISATSHRTPGRDSGLAVSSSPQIPALHGALSAHARGTANKDWTRAVERGHGPKRVLTPGHLRYSSRIPRVSKIKTREATLPPRTAPPRKGRVGPRTARTLDLFSVRPALSSVGRTPAPPCSVTSGHAHPCNGYNSSACLVG